MNTSTEAARPYAPGDLVTHAEGDDGPWPKPLTHEQYLFECDVQERHPTCPRAWYDDELTMGEAVDWRGAAHVLGIAHPLDVQQLLHRWRVPVRVWIGEYDGLTTYYSRRAVLQLAEMLKLRQAAGGGARG